MVEDADAPWDPMLPASIPPPNPPPLRRLSDWMYVVWADYCGNDATHIAGLEWVIHLSVSNPSTLDVAMLVGGYEPWEATPEWPEYPGWKFSIPDERNPPPEVERDDFYALVGCPNGFGVAYMLQQRRSAFNKKVIDRVNVFSPDGEELTIAFHLGSVQGHTYAS